MSKMLMLSKDQELSLLKSYLKGDKEAAIELSKEVGRLSVLVASKYTPVGGEHFPRCVSMAYVGFFKGLEKYLENKRYKSGQKLTTYAIYFMKQKVEMEY